MKKFTSPDIVYDVDVKDKVINITVEMSYRIPRVSGDEITNHVVQKINKILVPDSEEGCTHGSFVTFRSDVSNILYIRKFTFRVWIEETTTYKEIETIIECVKAFFEELTAHHRFLYELVKVNDEKEVEND